MVRCILSLLLLCLVTPILHADPGAQHYATVRLQFEGSRGEQISSLNYQIIVRDRDGVQLDTIKTSATAGSGNTFGPFRQGSDCIIRINRALSNDGFITLHGLQTARLQAGENVITVKIDFDQWQFNVNSVTLQFDPAAEKYRNQSKGQAVLYLPDQHITDPTTFPVESALIPRDTIAYAYASYESDYGLYGIHRVEVKPGTKNVALTVPVKLEKPESAQRYNLIVIITDVDAEHPVTLFKILSISLDSQTIEKTNTSQDVFYATNLTAGETHRVCVIAQDMKDRVAANCVVVEPQKADAEQIVDPLYTKVLGLKFVTKLSDQDMDLAYQGVDYSNQSAGTTIVSTGNSGQQQPPTVDGLEKTLKNNNKAIVTTALPLTQRSNAPVQSNSEKIIFSMFELQSGDVSDTSKPAILDPNHITIVVQYPDGSNAMLSGQAAIKVMRAHGFLKGNTLELTVNGRRGYEGPDFVNPKPKPAAAVPMPANKVSNAYWLVEARYEVQNGASTIYGYAYGTPYDKSAAAAVAQYRDDNHEDTVVGKYIDAGMCSYRDRKQITVEGHLVQWTAQAIGGPYPNEAAADKAKQVVNCW